MGKAKKTLSAKSNVRRTKTPANGKKRTDSDPKAHAPAGTVVMDRRGSSDRRAGEERRKADTPVAAERRNLERRQKTNRRRQIDPTTCERNYSTEEIEFMTALEGYKRTSGRMFPTCSEILEVLRGLGYEKPVKVELAVGGESAASQPSLAPASPESVIPAL